MYAVRCYFGENFHLMIHSNMKITFFCRTQMFISIYQKINLSTTNSFIHCCDSFDISKKGTIAWTYMLFCGYMERFNMQTKTIFIAGTICVGRIRTGGLLDGVHPSSTIADLWCLYHDGVCALLRVQKTHMYTTNYAKSI